MSSTGTMTGTINIGTPLCVGLMPNGNLLIGHGNQVDCFTAAGVSLFTLGQGAGEFGKPNDLTVASDGTIYVTDSKMHLVKVYHGNGNTWFSFGTCGTGDGQFIFPTGICLNTAENEVYVADQGNGRVEVFNRNGVYQRQFGSLTHQVGANWVFDGTFTRVQSIAIDQFDRIYVSDLYQNDVQVLTSTGSFLGRITPNTTSPFAQPADIAIRGSQLVVLSSLSSQVYTYDLDDVTGANEPNTAANFTFALERNYPNPFNNSTRIPFTLNRSGHVSLTVWNMLGQRVATVIDGQLSAGRHEVIWNTNSGQHGYATSGVYYCRLTVADGSGASMFQATSKLLYLK